jgi:hypothetical protein
MVRGGDTDVNELTSSIRQRIRWFLIEHRNIINGDKNSLLNAVNILINNDLYKMKNLLVSLKLQFFAFTANTYIGQFIIHIEE